MQPREARWTTSWNWLSDFHASNAPQLQHCVGNMPEIENPAPGSAAQIEPELLTKAEAAQLLGVSIRSVDNMMRQRRISFVKLTAKMVRFPRREILQHIREHLTVHAQGS
jgi:excisionase family DNA binding protein